MEREISAGATLGIVLIALAAIIGLGFGIFAIAKGTANEGVVNVQDNLGQVSTSAFNDYDQKTVTGTQVMSAYNNYAGKPYAILVSTQAYTDDQSNVLLTSVPSVATTNTTGMNFNSLAVPVEVPLKFLNYNALVGGTIKTVAYNNGFYTARSGFAMTTAGSMTFNSTISNLSKSGKIEYIPSGARFEANLVKDVSGTIMGIAFRQVAVNK